MISFDPTISSSVTSSILNRIIVQKDNFISNGTIIEEIIASNINYFVTTLVKNQSLMFAYKDG